MARQFTAIVIVILTDGRLAKLIVDWVYVAGPVPCHWSASNPNEPLIEPRM